MAISSSLLCIVVVINTFNMISDVSGWSTGKSRLYAFMSYEDQVEDGHPTWVQCVEADQYQSFKKSCGKGDEKWCGDNDSPKEYLTKIGGTKKGKWCGGSLGRNDWDCGDSAFDSGFNYCGGHSAFECKAAYLGKVNGKHKICKSTGSEKINVTPEGCSGTKEITIPKYNANNCKLYD